jgi:superfamily II DNA or RNA helicase
MKFTLNDYQNEAVSELLTQLEAGRELYHRATHPQETSVALTAPTGAGKTVIAAATLEALFFGSDEFDFKADPSAVVIWFSDSPNLNQQSLFRLMEASEKLTFNRLKTVKPPFSMRELETGTVYFLNTARLGKNSLLTRGYQEDADSFEDFDALIQPDDQAYTIWQTIANTIANPDKTVYFVLDEAHRGYDKRQSTERATIVRRLVDGDDTGSPIPIVLGISATIERFAKAMKEASTLGNRLALDNVTIEPSRVIESGLLKDTVLLEIPGEGGDLHTNLVKEAAKKLDASTLAWKRYSNRQKLAEPVIPLLVLQVENTPDPSKIGDALDVIREELKEIALESVNVRHVLSDSKSETFGSWEIDWIEPQRVQQETRVRVLIAKEAISTGWDCPRAEVLVSFRPARDQTHIAQLLGRMVRSPLAMRIPGNDQLNSVNCLLPYFDKTTAGKIVRYITGADDELPMSGGASTPMLDGRLLEANPNIDEKVWDSFDNLATQSVPKRGVKPIKRLVSLAQALAHDNLWPAPLEDLKSAVHELLTNHSTKNKVDFDLAVKEIYDVHIEVLKGKHGHAIEYSRRTVTADDRAILTGFEEAQRVFGSDIALSYVNHLVELAGGDDDDLRDAYVRTSAVATLPRLQEEIDELSERMASAWLLEHKSAIAELSDERQIAYDNIRSMATEPQTTSMRRPTNRLAEFGLTDEGLELGEAPRVKKHLMSDANGDYPIGTLNGWEQEVIAVELARPESVAWYRNPAHNGADSVTVAYRDTSGWWRSLHPDFVFFNAIEGEIRPSIVDPHATNLDDWLVKVKGLASFADRYGDKYERILSVVKHGTKWRALEMKRADVRDVVLNFSGEATILYSHDVAEDYA